MEVEFEFKISERDILGFRYKKLNKKKTLKYLNGN